MGNHGQYTAVYNVRQCAIAFGPFGMSLHIDASTVAPHSSTQATMGDDKENTVMKMSARNQFVGTIREVAKGPASTEVTIEIAPGIRVVAVISSRSAEALALAIGKPAYALIKASSIMVAVD